MLLFEYWHMTFSTVLKCLWLRTHPRGLEVARDVPTSTNKRFGHGAPVSEGRAVSSVDGGCSSSAGLSVKEFTNSDIANGLRFPLNLKLQEIEVIKWHVPVGVL